VTDVEDGSEAEQADVRPVTSSWKSTSVRSTRRMNSKVVGDDGKKKGVVMLQIKRQRQSIFRTVPLSASK